MTASLEVSGQTVIIDDELALLSPETAEILEQNRLEAAMGTLAMSGSLRDDHNNVFLRFTETYADAENSFNAFNNPELRISRFILGHYSGDGRPADPDREPSKNFLDIARIAQRFADMRDVDPFAGPPTPEHLAIEKTLYDKTEEVLEEFRQQGATEQDIEALKR